jgi:serine/threonine protein kinase
MHSSSNSDDEAAGKPVSSSLGEEDAAPSPRRWLPPSAERLARLLPQFQVERLLGAGGMGAVYLGTQVSLHRKVAIKLLPAELAGNTEFVNRFKREARTLARLQHPGIVAVHDFGQTTEGHLFFIMEYVDGTDLARLIHSPGLEASQALEITIQVCEALHYAHDQGVIHRDIKPANVLITQDGRAKLADFGLARPITNLPGEITATRIIMGTPDYMAPEQWQGGEDHRADIYALGVMLYEMLTGALPRGAFDLPSHKSQVDSRLDEVVIKAMRQTPEQRYQAVSEMRDAVRRIRTTQPMPDGARQAENASAQLAQFGWQDRFTLQEKIGKGGSGQVWRAWDHEKGQIVALKLLVPERQGDEGAMARIEGEADTLRRLHGAEQHPNVVKVFDFALAEEQVCLVMQHVLGQTLAAETTQSFPTMRDAAALVRTLADACGWFHQLGVIHRDLKPENIMIAEGSGAPVIIDFSIAKDEELMTLTLTQQALGTAAYMAPEQFGTSQGRVTPAADVFALGVILYELLTGHLPYAGDYFEIYQQKTTGQRPPYPRLLQPAIPRALEAIVWQALSPVPTDRYADGHALAEDLGRWLDSSRVQAPHITRRKHLAARLYPWLPRPLTAVVAAGLIGTPLGWFAWPSLKFQTSSAAASSRARQAEQAPLDLSLPKDEPFQLEAGFTDLFSPKKLPFWKDADMGGFRVKDGVATSWTEAEDPQAGLWTYTEHTFSDFVLRLQFRADKETSNSGVFLRCYTTPKGKMISRCQVQVGPYPRSNPTGSIYNAQAAKPVPLRAKGQWNDLEITSKGSKVSVIVNGNLVNEYQDSGPQSGYIALQNHQDGVVSYRRIRLQSLAPPVKMALPPVVEERLNRRTRRESGKTIPGVDDVFPPLQGDWIVVFKSGLVHRYLIYPDGRIKIGELTRVASTMDLRSGSAWLDYDKGRVEKFAVIGGRLQVQAWSTADRAGTASAEDVGTGERHDTPGPLDESVEMEMRRSLSATTMQTPYENSLGMRFVPLPRPDGSLLLCSIWETRVRDYAAYAKMNAGVDDAWKRQEFLKRPVSRQADEPVVSVNWHDAWRFCDWLTREEKKRGLLPSGCLYRLPTDAEWSGAVGIEHLEDYRQSAASRSNALVTHFPWGEDFPPPNHAGNYADQTHRQEGSRGQVVEGHYDDGFFTSSPVGSFPPNKLGIYDLGGNVWEWCEDWYDPMQRDTRILRGAGYFDYDPRRLRSSSRRTGGDPLRRTFDFGFRVVLEVRAK